MSKFEPKIHPTWNVGNSDGNGVMWVRKDEAERQIAEFVTSNLRAFKAEFLRRFTNDGELRQSLSAPVKELWNHMLPDDPPKATGDDARDAARFRWLKQHKGCFVKSSEGWYVTTGLYGTETVKNYGTLDEAIDAAMAREASK